MIKDHLIISVKNLRTRRLRSWLTMIGIFIGIASIISLVSLGEGLRNAIASQFSMLGTDMLTVQASGVQFGPPGTGVVNPLQKENVNAIERIPGVEFAIPRIIKSAKIDFNEKASFTVVGSLPAGEQRKFIEDRLGLKSYKGRLLKDEDKLKIVVGNDFNDDSLFGKPVNVGDSLLINDKQFEVVGILKKIGNFFLDNAVMMNEDVERDLFNDKEDVSLIVVKVKKNADINSVKEDIEKTLRKKRNVKEGQEDFSVEVAADILKTLEDTLFAVQLFVYIIAGISLIVGGIGIMNTMYTAVVERTKDIGIMKSIGAKNNDIFLLFFFESGLLGLIGGFIGIIAGATFAKLLALIGSSQLNSNLIQAQISFFLVAGSLLFSFVVGCIAGITPALRAAKLNPVEALRYAK